MAAPWQIYTRARQNAQSRGAPLTGLGGGALKNNDRLRLRTLVPDAEYRRNRSHDLNTQFDTALADPVGTAGLFRGFYQDAADAYTAQAGRDFQRNIGTVAGNIGRRFGGNASSYEQAQVNKAGDVFARNTSEALAGLAPQAAAQGLQYTGLLGNAAAQGTNDYQQMLQLLLDSLKFQRSGEQKSGLLGGVGAALGGIAGSFLGPAGTAFGASAGRSIF